MITIKKTQKYQKFRNKFVENNLQRAKLLIKTLRLFTSTPTYPSLHLEKLGGTEVWTIRVDKANRIFFLWIDTETVLFIDIGHHDKYRRY